MAKLILRCNYMKGAPAAHLSNYVHYMGTRPGVGLVDDGKGALSATVKQKRLVEQITKDFPSAKDMLEYSDYLASPTRNNSQEFIMQALEYNLDMAAKRENYVDYIGTRPRAERMGEHGLFTDEGVPVVMSRLQKGTKGKKQYGYMPKEVKGIIDRIVDELAKEDTVSTAYIEWHKQWCEILKTYKTQISDLPPLSEQETFKSIKNTVIAEALKLSDHGVFVSESSNTKTVDSPPDVLEAEKIVDADEDEIIPSIISEDEISFDPESATPPEPNTQSVPPSTNPSARHVPVTPMTAATNNILRALSRQFSEKADEMLVYRAQHERKVLSREKRKKIAQGHAEDEREFEQKI